MNFYIILILILISKLGKINNFLYHFNILILRSKLEKINMTRKLKKDFKLKLMFQSIEISENKLRLYISDNLKINSRTE